MAYLNIYQVGKLLKYHKELVKSGKSSTKADKETSQKFNVTIKDVKKLTGRDFN